MPMMCPRSPEREPLDLHLSSYKQRKPQNKAHKQSLHLWDANSAHGLEDLLSCFPKKKIFCVWVSACMYVCTLHACLLPSEAKEGHPSPRNGVTDGCKSQHLRARK